MAGLIENPMYNKLAQAGYRLGSELQNMRPVSTGQFNNVRGAVKSGVQPSAPVSNPQLNQLGKITTPYGGQTAFEGYHKGVDVAAPIGTNLPALTPGKVINVQTGFSNTPNKPSYGNSIVIQTPTGEYVRYSHLNNAFVKTGDTVTRGQSIGEIGNTGGAYSTSGGTGSHLDLRIYSAAKEFFNPSEYLNNYS